MPSMLSDSCSTALSTADEVPPKDHLCGSRSDQNHCVLVAHSQLTPRLMQEPELRLCFSVFSSMRWLTVHSLVSSLDLSLSPPSLFAPVMTGEAHVPMLLSGLCSAGGVIGYMKARSPMSLVGGLGIGAAYAGAAYLINNGEGAKGHLLGLGASVLLTAAMGRRYGKTGQSSHRQCSERAASDCSTSWLCLTLCRLLHREQEL